MLWGAVVCTQVSLEQSILPSPALPCPAPICRGAWTEVGGTLIEVAVDKTPIGATHKMLRHIWQTASVGSALHTCPAP